MIVVFNGMAWGFEHAAFDAAFLAAVAQAFPEEPIHFHGERDHVCHTKHFLDAGFAGAQVVWRELVLPPRLASSRERLAHDFRMCKSMLSEASRRRATRVVACYVHPFTGTAALKVLSLAYRECPIAIIHHGNLRRLLASRRYRPLLLSFAYGRLRHIVLGDFIRTEVVHQLPRLGQSLHAIRIPGFFEDALPSELPPSGPVSFSFLGLVDEMKGFPEFVELAASLAPSYGAVARFDLIGGTRVGPLPAASPFVQTYSQAGPMTREAFDQQLRQTTYTVFPYNQSYYRLIASASVLDALSAGKPLIALRSPQFEDMFQAMGDIGYLCDDLQEMKTVIVSILRQPPRERYRQQSQNILMGRGIFAPPSVAVQLRDALLRR